MSEVADCHFPLDIYARQERPLIVNPKGKDAVLVWQFECGAKDGTVGSCRDGLEIEAVEG